MTPDDVRAAAGRDWSTFTSGSPRSSARSRRQDHAHDYLKGLMVCPEPPTTSNRSSIGRARRRVGASEVRRGRPMGV